MDWLFVIDLQPAFNHPDSPWFTPPLEAAKARIADLVPAFGDRVLFSRFVPPPEIGGSWRAYYEKWRFATDPAGNWLWQVESPWQGRRSVASHRFSKWTAEARAIIPEAAEIVLCGVSTDCCVLATALEAVDDGRQIRLVTDACAAKSEVEHQGALAILKARAPMLTLTDTATELARAAPSPAAATPPEED